VQWRIQDLTLGVRGLCQRGGGGGGGFRKSLKVLKVEVEVIFSMFGHISIKIMLKKNREQSERRQFLEKLAFWT